MFMLYIISCIPTNFTVNFHSISKIQRKFPLQFSFHCTSFNIFNAKDGIG